LPVQLKKETLNRLHLALLEIWLAALAAYPGGNCLQGQVIPLAVNMKRRPSFRHFPLAVNAFHEGLLITKLGEDLVALHGVQ
jgi:hypothetical protein